MGFSIIILIYWMDLYKDSAISSWCYVLLLLLQLIRGFGRFLLPCVRRFCFLKLVWVPGQWSDQFVNLACTRGHGWEGEGCFSVSLPVPLWPGDFSSCALLPTCLCVGRRATLWRCFVSVSLVLLRQVDSAPPRVKSTSSWVLNIASPMWNL